MKRNIGNKPDVDDTTIHVSIALKYVGMWIYKRTTIAMHMPKTLEKVAKTITAL